jgi:hypothetical protein
MSGYEVVAVPTDSRGNVDIDELKILCTDQVAGLMLTNPKYSDTKLNLVGSEHLTSDYWWMNHLMITRDRKNNITGFVVNSGRIMHLKFNKTK